MTTTRDLIDTADGQRPAGIGFEPVARTDNQARAALRSLGERWAAGDAEAATYLAAIGYDDPADVAAVTYDGPGVIPADHETAMRAARSRILGA